MALSKEKYKELSIKEFTKAANEYESEDAGYYNIPKQDYPDLIAEIEKEKFQTLLDAGCGTAPLVSLIADKYPECHFYGIDITPKMIEIANDKHIKNATFVVGDCENLPFEENMFDVIVCSMSIHHYPCTQDFFNSVYRCLKPNGRLILRDVTSASILIWLGNKLVAPIVHLFGYGDVRAYTCKNIKQYCKQAGLKIDVCEQRAKFRLHCVARK